LSRRAGAGARTSEIALRYGLHRKQFYEWRRQFCSAAVADAGLVASDFAPVVAENQDGSGATAIEIEIGRDAACWDGVELCFFLGKGAAPVEGHEMLIATRPVWC
jgi:hypothetical protein